MTIGPVQTQFLQIPTPFHLESGEVLNDVTIAYETYGILNADASNAILVFHALTGSHHAAGINTAVSGVEPLWTKECIQGWWDDFIGPGKAIDTDQHFVICANYLGSCYGSTGPRSINPKTGKAYGSSFPQISAFDVIRSQKHLLRHFKIDCLRAVVGGSLGGMMAMMMAIRCPEMVKTVIPLATGVETTALQRILNFEQIVAIRNDPNFLNGDYYEHEPPREGLALARMIAHKTFVSLKVMEGRARQEIITDERIGQFYSLSHPIESYMLYQGCKFAERFDANSYLRIMALWQHYSLGQIGPDLFRACKDQKYLIFSIDSDVCFYPEEQRSIVQALEASKIDVKYITVHSDKGHDSFLLEPELYAPYIHFVLNSEN
ncbi:homoserine O-acetyltransferase [filamentous cyanobacterium LEGE 11480]|uniref:Homoserine O-acetyltransferase n=1 Tax=Romeriopsis navalis LEGE 11480 TaxID=2777977 RepID=A0A928VPR9_9CYAN|nr:homoserine O-acetyltransferase [Romeriopsis navalis]MBE9032533.1 homoserine O-acetyltransferase [Romeriopsis navalis LEGE 11480]